jgi:hypothetical protein
MMFVKLYSVFVITYFSPQPTSVRMFQHPALEELVKRLFFQSKNGTPIAIQNNWTIIPLGAYAVALTAVIVCFIIFNVLFIIMISFGPFWNNMLQGDEVKATNLKIHLIIIKYMIALQMLSSNLSNLRFRARPSKSEGNISQNHTLLSVRAEPGELILIQWRIFSHPLQAVHPRFSRRFSCAGG